MLMTICAYFQVYVEHARCCNSYRYLQREDHFHRGSQRKPYHVCRTSAPSSPHQQVSWIDNGTDVPLGVMNLNTPLQASHKRATLNQTTQFNITDEAAFGRFTAAMITQPNFTWHLVSNGLRVNALKFPVATGIHFNKMVTLGGIDNFQGNVVLQDFQLPSDAPDGQGINFVAVTGLNNTR